MVKEKTVLERIAEALLATLWKFYALIMGLFGIDVRPVPPELADKAVGVANQIDAAVEQARNNRPAFEVQMSLGEKAKRTAQSMITADTTRVCGCLNPALPADADVLEWLRGPAAYNLDQIAASRARRIEEHLEGVREIAGLPTLRQPEPSVTFLNSGHIAEEEDIRNAVIERIVGTDPDNTPDVDDVEEEVQRWLERGVLNSDLAWIAAPLSDGEDDETTALSLDLARE